MPVKNPIDCFKKYGVKDLSTQLQKRIDEGANPYEAAREIIVAEHRRLHETTNEIRALGKLKKLPYAEQKDISQQIKQLNEAKTSAAANQPISNIESFKTSQGSVYNVLPDGRTQRFKTKTGEQNEPQDLTVFVDFKGQQEDNFLEAVQRNKETGDRVYVSDEKGKVIRTYAEAKGKKLFLVIVNKDGKPTEWVEAVTTPTVGKNVFDMRSFEKDGETFTERHIGNKVTEIKKQDKPNGSKTSSAANQPIQQTATESAPQIEETVTEPTPTGTTEAGQVGAGRTPPVLKSRKGIVNKARDIEDLTDPRDIVMQYFVGGNRINSSAIKELFGGKDDRLHFSKGTKGEYQSRISLIKSDAPSIKELAHQLWENSGGLEEGYNYTDRDFRDAIEAVLKDHNSPASMATELVDRYVNAAVKEDLTEAEAKQINDGLIADLQKYVTDLPENQQNELLSLLSKYQDKYGFVDWAKLEQDTNGFEPEILSLPTQTQEALDGIIQKNIQSGQGELSNTSRQDSSQKENQEKIIAEGAATVQLANKIRGLKIDLSKLSGGGMQSNVLGLPVSVWNTAMDIVAKTVETGGQIADAIKRGVNYIQKNHRGQWDKKAFNDQVMKELGVRGITVNGEDFIVKNDAKTEREFAETVNGWYSDLEQSVLDVKGDKGSGEQWKKALGNSDEAKWTGLNDWLSQQKGQVSKKDIQNYLKDNRIEIVEVVKSDEPIKESKEYIDLNNQTVDAFMKVNEARNKWYETKEDKDFDEIEKRQKEANKLSEKLSKLEKQERNPISKFSQYQLEGEKTNYKEVLVTMPSATKVKMPKPVETYTGSGKYKLVFENGDQLSGTYTKEEVADVLKRRSEDKTGMYVDRNEQFKSSHFDEPNILVHLRMNTRTDAEGKKVLFLEEVQSDWGQKGKKEGFDSEKNDYKAIADRFAKGLGFTQGSEADVKLALKRIKQKSNIWEREYAAFKEAGFSDAEINKMAADYTDGQTPSAPFVTDTNSWTKLGLKVALKEAVKQGADKIAWTTGEQQNDRYDLSKQVQSISYEKKSKEFSSKAQEKGQDLYSLYIETKESGYEQFDDLTISEVEGYVGKDIANKIQNNEGNKENLDTSKGNKKVNKLIGIDLKVGGKGMKGFYGSPTEGSLGIVGNVAKSLFKQEPKTVKIETGETTQNILQDNIREASIKEGEEGDVGASYIFGRLLRARTVTDANSAIRVMKEENLSKFGVTKKSFDIVEGFIKENSKSKTLTQHSIDITPELKAEVEGGLPLFKDIKGRGKAIADALRKGKIKMGGLQSNIAGIPAALWNAAIDTIALAIEGGATLAQAVQKAIKKHSLDKQKEFNQKEFISKLEEASGEKLTEGAATVPVEPPAEPPKTPPAAGGEQGGSRKKGILNRLYEAKNVPQAAKEGFERAGLDYETASQEEAAKVAKAVVEEFGIDEAVTMAEAQKFDGDVNSLIFAESLNSLSEQIDAVATEAEKVELAKKFAEVAITYDKMGRVKAGRFNAAINYFYKKSPLGVVFYENANRADEFAQFSKGKEKSWQETYDELKQNPEFAKLFKEEVSGEVETKLKEERKSARATRIEKVRDVFKSAKEKFRKEGGGTYSTIIPPHVLETVLEAMELAYEAGEAALKIIEDAVKAISDKIGNDWDKDKFRKEWETKLSDGKKKALTDEELKERVIEKFRKKMKGLSDKQKEEVIRKSYRKLIENGALDHDDFKKIIAEVTGRGELTEAEAKKMKELTQKTNDLEVAAKKWRDEKTKDAQVGFTKAQIEAAQANKELQDMFYNKPDIIKRLTSIMQLSTLGIPALVNNPIYNLWNQMALRFPVGLINDLLDRGIAAAARIGGKNYQKEYNIIAAQKGFFETLGVGGKEAVEQIFTGLNRQDYLQKELYGQQLRPFRAIRDLIAYKQGKKKLTSRQIVDKTLQASVGIPAEVVARLLNIGDKPMRFGAEGGTAAQFAKTLGLQGMDFDLFVNFPREEAYRVYKGMGLSDEVAGQKADYVKAAIMKEGMRSTFQQDNLANEGLTRLFSILGGKESGTANLAKVLTISPYVKIPLNAGWSTYNLINPEVAILQAFVHGGRAWKLARSGKTTDSQLALREARYWFGHAIVGVATRAVVLALIGSGRFSPGSDEDETKKKRDARFYFDKPGTIEVGGQKIADRWFGQFGAVKNAIAKRYYDSTPEQREKQQEFWNIVLGGMELEGLQEFQNSVFANTSALAQVLETGNPDRYITNTINMFTNIIQPASWAQMERAALDEVPTSRGDNLLDKINQEFAKRSTVYRQITGTDIYKKRDIWGNRMPKGGNIISRAFGISKANPQLPARPMFDDYLRTGDSGFLPPAVLPTIDGQKLNQDQYDRLQKYIGNERQHLTEPFVAGDVVTKVTKKYYKDMTDDEKKDYLNALYTEGRIRGTEKFYTDYPQFRPKEKSIKKQVSDVLQNADLELMKIKDK